jgi:D-amino peptidase
MKILIAADMEGISGVTNWDQVDPQHAEYTRFRKIMTADVNAAIIGAFASGADEVIVTDGHGEGSNILIEELDGRARLNAGNGSPFSMVQGVDAGVDGVLYVGYHARAGSQNGVMAHTWSASRVANLWLNDILLGEYGLNGALAGHFGVPVLMISGDQTACAQAMEQLGALETAVVKQATGFASAECLPLDEARELIYVAASRAIQRLKAGEAPPPFVLAEPVRVTIEFRQPEFADRGARLPGARRLDGLRIEFTVTDMPAAHAGFRAAVRLAMD